MQFPMKNDNSRRLYESNSQLFSKPKILLRQTIDDKLNFTL